MSSTMPPEPIAIVGMACRLPGGVSNPEEFWALLVNGKSGYADFPSDRVNIDAWHHHDATWPGSFVTRGGYFVDQDLHDFDNDFFGISPVEASTMDPAQKQLLEIVYEACDGAGISQEQLAGSSTGVYVGNFCPEQSLVGLKDMESMTPYTATGASTAMLSNRINYVFDLKGPSLTVDTACASSAYALHLACAGLRAGDCDAALVCAANTIRSVEAQMFMSKLGALSPTSRCHTFDASADGYARADGIVALYVMRLSDAVRLGRPIRAVIRGTAIGANGSGESLTKPSGTAQADVIRKAYENSGIADLGNTGYFECHGTGTPVGDKIETHAVADVFSSHRTTSDPLLVGSVKTNVGHSEGAAALTALVKAVLAIQNKMIPPTIGIQRLNPNIDFDSLKIKVVQALTPWPATVSVRRASLNCFGFGGANAHIVVEEADAAVRELMQLQNRSSASYVDQSSSSTDSPSPLRSPASFTCEDEPSGTTSLSSTCDSTSDNTALLVCSAKSDESLNRTIDTIRLGLPIHSARDIAHTLANRSKFNHRAFAISDGVREPSFQCGLKCQSLQLGFIFTGGGAQWPNMGQQLLQFPAFRRSICLIDNHVATLPDPPNWTIEKMMQADVSSHEMDEPRVAQYMTPALEIGLVDLLADWGIRPSMVAGHSAGEIAAAYAAGYLTRSEAATVAYYRGKATSEAAMEPGAMLAVGLSAAECHQLIPDGAYVVVAAVNSPKSVTLSGHRDAIVAIQNKCDRDNVFNRLIASNGVAYHSGLMKPAAEAYIKPLEALLRPSTKLSNETRMYSTLTGALYTESTLPTVYWRENMENPVLFSSAVAAMRESGMTHLAEIGPHSTLRSPAMEIIKSVTSKEPFTYFPAMRRKEDAVSVILNLCGNLALAGVEVDVSRVNGGSGVHLSDFPTYSWSHRAIFQESRADRELRLRKYPRHDLLGSLIPGSTLNTKIWRNILSSNWIPWLSEYKIGENCIFPTSGFVCMAVEAFRQTCEPRDDCDTVIEDLAIGTTLLVNDDVEVFLTMTQQPFGSNITSKTLWDFTICSIQNSMSIQHCQGRIHSNVQTFPAGTIEVSPGVCVSKAVPVPDGTWYQDLASKHATFLGERLRKMANMAVGTNPNHAVASIDLDSSSQFPMDSARSSLILDPIVLESCFLLPLIAAGPSRRPHPYLPVSVDRLAISNKLLRGSKVQVAAHAEYVGLHGLQGLCSMKIGTDTMVEIQGLRLSRLPEPVDRQKQQERSPFWRLSWVDDYQGITQDNEAMYFPREKNSPKVYKDLRRRRSYLTQMWVVQFSQQYPHLLLREPVNSQYKHFSEWINWLLDVTKNEFPEMYRMSLEERHSAIESQRQMEDLGTNLSWAIYDHLGELMEGTRSAVDLIAQNSLLSQFYEARLDFKKLERMVELMGLHNPSMRILEIGAGTGYTTGHVLKSLNKKSSQRYSGYTFTDTSSPFLKTAAATFAEYSDIEYKIYDMGSSPVEQGIDTTSYDMVIASCAVHTTPSIVQALQRIRSLLRPGGTLLLFQITAEHHDINFSLGLLPGFRPGYDDSKRENRFLAPEEWAEVFVHAGFNMPKLSMNDASEDSHALTVLSATTANPDEQKLHLEEHITVVSWETPTSFAICIADEAQKQGIRVAHKSMMSLKGSETEAGKKSDRFIFLAELEKEPDTWSRDGQFCFTSDAPSGLKQAKSLLWVTQKDLMQGNEPTGSGLYKDVMQYATRTGLKVASMDFEAAASQDGVMAREILRRESLLPHLEDTEFRQFEGRWLIPRFLCDEQLTQTFARLQGLDTTPSSIVLSKSDPLRLSVEGAVSLDTFAFERNTDIDGAIPLGYLEIKVKATGINMTDFLGLTKNQGTRSLSSEFAGVVTNVGDDVVNFSVGDAVLGLWPGRFENVIRVPEYVCQMIRPGDGFDAAATLPFAYCSAWRAVIDAARTQPGDSILIQSASGAVGMAAIAIARDVGAEIYATTGSAAKRAALYDLGIPDSRIFSSKDINELAAMRKVTGGRGFDVVLNTSSDDYLHTVSWPIVAPFGRFIELRTSASLAAEGVLWNLKRMSDGVSIIPVDMSRLHAQKPQTIANLMRSFGARYHSGALSTLPYRTFPISQLGKAYSEFSRFDHTGKLVLSYRDGDTMPFLSMSENPRFKPDGTYMLIGAVGDFMVQLTSWMVQNGARHFIFVDPHPSAQGHQAWFWDDLKAAGITTQYVPWNAFSINDARQAIFAVSVLPLLGVIELVVGVEEPLRSVVYENNNLEKETNGHKASAPMSLYSTIKDGDVDLDFLVLLDTKSDPTYCQDVDDWCRIQQAQGSPCASIHVMSTQSTNEIFQLGCAALGDLLTCASRQIQKPIYILADTDAGSSIASQRNTQHHDARWALVKNQDNILKRKAAALGTRSAVTSVDAADAVDDIQSQIVARLSKLLWIPREELRSDASLDVLSVDSMIAIEFQSWIQQMFHASISMTDLLSEDTTIRELSKLLCRDSQKK